MSAVESLNESANNFILAKLRILVENSFLQDNVKKVVNCWSEERTKDILDGMPTWKIPRDSEGFKIMLCAGPSAFAYCGLSAEDLHKYSATADQHGSFLLTRFLAPPRHSTRFCSVKRVDGEGSGGYSKKKANVTDLVGQ